MPHVADLVTLGLGSRVDGTNEARVQASIPLEADGDAEDFGKAGDRLGVRGLLGLGDLGGDGACWPRPHRIGAKADLTVQL